MKMIRTKTLWTIIRGLPALAILMLALPASAQIYRCEADGATVFSDRPCGPDAQAHRQSATVSYVEPDANLPAQAAAAHAFIEKRRAMLARRSQVSPTAAEQTAAPLSSDPVFLPWPVHIGRAAGSHHFRHSGPAPQLPNSERYSPLNGPILGTRGTPPFRVRLGSNHEDSGNR